MKLEALHADKYNGSFSFSGTSNAYINAIRRYIVNKVPTMAIEDVTFVENGSALYDEMLAHRMGLVPFKTDAGSYNVRSECKCKGSGCARCQLTMTLNKTGPCMVYAEHIKTKDPKVVPVHPKMPLAKLFEGQTIKAEMVAILGNGKEHIKFSPGLVFFQGYPSFKIKEAKNAKECAEICPKGILKFDGKKLKVTDEAKCDLCKACEDMCPDGIKVEASTEDFILTVESWGQLTLKEIFTSAAEEFDKDLDELDEEIKGLKPEK
ncbi:MAG TPA: DNA-directed RNA polymerase subunit D [Nanoarchaeota archaeon]|nr:DNA-directed RNA polymerase subunit D [Nanoarchaeota archaeon]